MRNVASRETRYVNFSFFYHDSLREVLKTARAEHDPQAGHDYSYRVANVVVLAAFVTEAAINEIAYWLQTHLTKPVLMPAGFDLLPTCEKWQVLAQACGAAGFDKGSRPWQDFNSLITLRNALAHAKAYPDGPEKVLRLLESRGHAQKGSDWFESLMTLRTAKWASEAAAAMPQALKDMLEPLVDLQNGGFSWKWGPEWFHPV